MNSRLNWGTGIALVYVAFTSATVGVVVFAMNRPVVLVTPEYYAESLRQDERNEAIRNSRALGDSASIVRSDSRTVSVSIPREQARSAHGSITLYRASDAAADRTLDLAVDAEGHQSVPVGPLAPGHWLVQLRWTAGGRGYYTEQALVLP